MTEQLALQQKLHTPHRASNENFEDYKKRRKDSHELCKLMRRGRLVHRSMWYTEETDKENNPVLKRHYKTYRKYEGYVL